MQARRATDSGLPQAPFRLGAIDSRLWHATQAAWEQEVGGAPSPEECVTIVLVVEALARLHAEVCPGIQPRLAAGGVCGR